MSNQHVLKIHPAPLADLLSGAKTAEVRRNDRGFQVGDTVALREVNPFNDVWTGRPYPVRTISHIQTGYGLPDGFCVLSYADTAQREALAQLEAKHATWMEQYDSVVRYGNELLVERDATMAKMAEALDLLDRVVSQVGKTVTSDLREEIDALLDSQRLAQAEQQEAQPSGVQLEALKRFHETCDDGEAYDVPVETMHQLAAMGLVDPAPQYGEHGFSMNAKGYAALAPKQEAQGVQAGDERAAFEEWFFEANEISLDDHPRWNTRDELGQYRSGTVHDAWVVWQARAALATQPVVPVAEYPAGAIENGRVLLDRLEQWYEFRDAQGHPLANCAEWVEARQCFDHMAECFNAVRGAGHE